MSWDQVLERAHGLDKLIADIEEVLASGEFPEYEGSLRANLKGVRKMRADLARKLEQAIEVQP